MATLNAFIAVNRFGLGARPGELADASSDPKGWVLAQIGFTPPAPDLFSDLPAGSSAMADLVQARRQGADGMRNEIERQARELYRKEAQLRTCQQVTTDLPFRERLVAFWSNHFTVSVERPALFGLAGAFEREAIRPNVTGRFFDLLLAVARHPAMLVYLDNVRSVGPNSTAGERRGIGLNENFGRELLELHTLGVDGGYSQTDVTELARILTGWSLAGSESEQPGSFLFRPGAHEPGTKTFLGRTYQQAGVEEGLAALEVVATHPATARHLATKLARHFTSDEPPPALVERLAGVFRETEGNLREMTRALVEAPEPWAETLAKVKTPNEFLVSAWRATGTATLRERALGTLRLMGQQPFAAPSPNGWEDTAAAWASPEGLLQRAEWAMAAAPAIGRDDHPEELLAATIGPVASSASRAAVLRAPSAVAATALLLAAPEFQQR